MPDTLPSRRALLAGLAATALAIATTPPAFAQAFGAQTMGAQVGAGWADIDLIDGQDRMFRLDDLPATAVLIKLWASWCPVCLRELAALPAMAPALRARGLDIVLVSHPSDWRADQRLADSSAMPFRRARPAAGTRGGALAAELLAPDGFFYVPRSLVFDRVQRGIVWHHAGGLDWSSPQTLAGLGMPLG